MRLIRIHPYIPRFCAHGFTLIEVLVSLSLLGILLAMTSMSMVQNLNEGMSNEKRYEAIQAAQTVMDNLRFEDVTTFSAARTQSVVVGKRTYTVVTTFCEVDAFCASADVKHITVRVSHGAKKIYETDSVYSKL